MGIPDIGNPFIVAPGISTGALLGGIPVVMTEMLPDGEVLMGSDAGGGPALTVFIGTGPLSNAEWCRREAKRIVHEGMSDILAWLGMTPYQHRTGQQILDQLQSKKS